MKISIITATFNSGRTVGDTLESVLGQDYGDYELIIKDGGSKDDTLDICRSYEERFAGRMRIIEGVDGGLYDAMNQGIAAASGEVVGILNSDDYFTSNDILTIIAEAFELHPYIDAVYGDVHYVKGNDTSKIVRYYSSRLFRPSWMRMGFMPAHPSFYCKKSVYDKYKLNGRKIAGFKGNPDCAYFNTTYPVAADFEKLLRMIYIGNIKMLYIGRDFVTMRTGGISQRGMLSHKQINRDHMRAFRENGVYSNYFLISLRYCYKVLELIKGRLCRMMQ